jgi:hypothetical protein
VFNPRAVDDTVTGARFPIRYFPYFFARKDGEGACLLHVHKWQVTMTCVVACLHSLSHFHAPACVDTEISDWGFLHCGRYDHPFPTPLPKAASSVVFNLFPKKFIKKRRKAASSDGISFFFFRNKVQRINP